MRKKDPFVSAIDRDFRKVLVVDDILYVSKSIARTLKQEGYFVITALTGQDALEKYDKYTPSLITIDQNLPDMSGSALVTELLLRPSFSSRIVFISAVYDKDVIKSVLKLGVDHYLIKPFKKNKLIETVNSLIGTEEEQEEAKKNKE